jgi:hypothetical protein
MTKISLGIVCLIAAGGFASASTIPVYGTGYQFNNFVLQSDGLADGNFVLIADANDGTVNSSNPATAFVVNPTAYPLAVNAWIANSSTSKWIAPSADETNSNAGTFTYQETFSLYGFDPTTAVLSGAWATDNTGVIMLNGVVVGSSSSSYTTLTPFTISSGFLPGLNTLDFVVTNAPFAGTNPTGLRVDLTGTATAVPVPEPESVAFLGLGLATLGALRLGRRRA